jgi:hypothetical protein
MLTAGYPRQERYKQKDRDQTKISNYASKAWQVD